MELNKQKQKCWWWCTCIISIYWISGSLHSIFNSGRFCTARTAGLIFEHTGGAFWMVSRSGFLWNKKLARASFIVTNTGIGFCCCHIILLMQNSWGIERRGSQVVQTVPEQLVNSISEMEKWTETPHTLLCATLCQFLIFYSTFYFVICLRYSMLLN